MAQEPAKFEMNQLLDLIVKFKQNEEKGREGNDAAKTRARVAATAIGHQMDAYRKATKPSK
jgi:hypothetical protein